MSRSGYSDDCEHVELWRGAVVRATKGYRGQHLLKKLRAALDAMPSKRLIRDEIANGSGDVCAFGALDPAAPAYDGDDGYYHSRQLAKHFGIAPALAAEVVFMNDEWFTSQRETPEERWSRMRAWVDEQIVPEEPEAEK
jgi:hypothetical protein